MSGHGADKERFVIVADARRRWSRSEKQAIVAESGSGASSVSAVARKHNIAPSLLFRWRREFGKAKLPVPARPAFVPVALPLPGKATGNGGLIEIELVGGRRLRVDGSVDAGALRRVIAALEDGAR
jgi:transposase